MMMTPKSPALRMAFVPHRCRQRTRLTATVRVSSMGFAMCRSFGLLAAARGHRVLRALFVLSASCSLIAATTSGDEPNPGRTAARTDLEYQLGQQYTGQIRPLLTKYCGDCHSGDTVEAEINLDEFPELRELKRAPDAWLRIRGVLDTRQMPPKDSVQPSDQEMHLVQDWVRQFLRHEAEAMAGDPGPVGLRRLNNEEYAYTIQDLTGVVGLNPTREFPVDGAAGEGFINTASGQSMSPSLVGKYVDAAREVVQHAVLTPQGLAFSPGISRREWTDERIAAVQQFYRRFTDHRDVMVEVGGTGQVSNDGGAIPLSVYFSALHQQRQALQADGVKLAQIAAEQDLSEVYLQRLWHVLRADSQVASVVLQQLREQFQAAEAEQLPALLANLTNAQQKLWRFEPIGQLTEGGKQKTWMHPVSTVVGGQDLRIAAASGTVSGDAVSFWLAAHDLGDGNDEDLVVWKNPHLEFSPDATGDRHPPLAVRGLGQRLEAAAALLTQELPRTAQYLTLLVQAQRENQEISAAATAAGLNPRVSQRWAELLSLSRRGERAIEGLYTQRTERVQGYESVNGWGKPETPSMLTNRSEEDVTFLTLTVPGRSVVMHPSPSEEAIAAWRSPISGPVRLSGLVADADDKCGNGAAWRLELLSDTGSTVLAEGVFDNGQRSEITVSDEVLIAAEDVISLIVNARDGSHACDTTHVALTINESAGAQRTWDLADDVVDRILESNPLPDSFGNERVWHFCSTGTRPAIQSKIPPGSGLAAWRQAVSADADAEQIQQLGMAVQETLLNTEPQGLSDADQQMIAQLRHPLGALRWLLTAATEEIAIQAPFGGIPGKFATDADSVLTQAPSVVELSIPTVLAADAELVMRAELHASAAGGSVQVGLSAVPQEAVSFSAASPLLVRPGTETETRLQAALDEFRELFPAAVCYSRIVPVDEVVTMTLYFREDQHLQRLLLTEAEQAELERLWDDLLFVAQEPLALMVAFEQIYEFATQDRPDLVIAFGPMREPINQRGAKFRERLRQTEPLHLQAVLRFADRAWRRNLTEDEQQQLSRFYQGLRDEGMAHEQGIRLTLMRILSSPAFLYRTERAADGASRGPVTGSELAARLSYFLWSSTPDPLLLEQAVGDELLQDAVLHNQMVRMLQDQRVRRLAIQFACQWLHLRNFDQNDDKNETLYPQFADLRRPMYEETVLFFTDLFQRDGSVLDMLDSDHTFLNGSLAAHYGIPGIEGEQWQEVRGLKERGRGGVLGMASFLASQSGASRTSPILRGNWIYETLLGDRLPKPPPNVPQLPENVPSGLTERQLIEQHSSVPECARCHAKIDPYGFSLEQFDAIGRSRPESAETDTVLEDGTRIQGLSGLRSYLLTTRRDDFLKSFCRRLLGFALGREVILSDEPLLEEMQRQLEVNEYRFSAAVKTIVFSSQFRQIRGREFDSTAMTTGETP